MELVPSQSPAEAADLIEQAMEGSMALSTRRERPVAQPLLPLMQLATLMPAKRQHTPHALLGRPSPSP